MAKKFNPLKNAELVIRPSPKELKIVLIVLILLSMAALFALRQVHTGILEQTENLKDKASALEYENEELARKTGELGSDQSIQEIAKEELGWVTPDVVIISPES